MGLVLALELIRLLSTVDIVLLVQPDVILQRTILRQAWHNLGRHDGRQPGLTVGALDLKVAASAEVSLLRNRKALTARQSTKTGSFLSQADRATEKRFHARLQIERLHAVPIERLHVLHKNDSHCPNRTAPHTPKWTAPRTPKWTAPHTPKWTSPRARKRTAPLTPKRTAPRTPRRTAPHTPTTLVKFPGQR